MDWQTPAAIAVVALTLAVFLVRFLRRRGAKKPGCGGSCACPPKRR